MQAGALRDTSLCFPGKIGNGLLSSQRQGRELIPGLVDHVHKRLCRSHCIRLIRSCQVYVGTGKRPLTCPQTTRNTKSSHCRAPTLDGSMSNPCPQLVAHQNKAAANWVPAGKIDPAMILGHMQCPALSVTRSHAQSVLQSCTEFRSNLNMSRYLAA